MSSARHWNVFVLKMDRFDEKPAVAISILQTEKSARRRRSVTCRAHISQKCFWFFVHICFRWLGTRLLRQRRSINGNLLFFQSALKLVFFAVKPRVWSNHVFSDLLSFLCPLLIQQWCSSSWWLPHEHPGLQFCSPSLLERPISSSW